MFLHMDLCSMQSEETEAGWHLLPAGHTFTRFTYQGADLKRLLFSAEATDHPLLKESCFLPVEVCAGPGPACVGTVSPGADVWLDLHGF